MKLIFLQSGGGGGNRRTETRSSCGEGEAFAECERCPRPGQGYRRAAGIRTWRSRLRAARVGAPDPERLERPPARQPLPAPFRTRGWASQDARPSRWRLFLALIWTPSRPSQPEAQAAWSRVLTSETRRPCRAVGPAPRPECRDLRKPPPRAAGSLLTAREGEGPPGARAGPMGNPHSRARPLWCPLAVSPRHPAPGQSSCPRPGPNPGRETFRVSATSGTRGASLSGGRPRGAYLGAGAADRACAAPAPAAAESWEPGSASQRLCSLRGSLRSRPGVTFSLAPNPPPPTPSRLGPASRGLRRRGAPGLPSPALPSPPPLAAAAAASLFAPLSGCPPAAPTSFPPSSSPAAFSDCWRENQPPTLACSPRPVWPSPDAKGSDPAQN